MDGSFSLLSLYNQNSVNNNNAMTGFNLRISGTQRKYTLPTEIEVQSLPYIGSI